MAKAGVSLKTKGFFLGLSLLAAAAARGSGTAGGEMLAERLDARASALGDASAALASNAAGAAYNPAGLGALQGLDLSFLHWTAVAEVQYEAFACARPFFFGTPALLLAYRHLPDIENPGAVDPPVTANDLVLSLCYAHEVGSLLSERGFLPDFLRNPTAGVSLKYLRSHLGSYDASAFALDLGVKGTVWEDWTVGASLLNLGPPIRFISVSDPLPAEFLAGVARTWALGKSHVVTATLDLEEPFEDTGSLARGELRSHGGVEDLVLGVLALRLGYGWLGSQSLGGPTAGIGILLEQAPLSFRFDYTYKPVYYDGLSSSEGQNLVSVGVGF